MRLGVIRKFAVILALVGMTLITPVVSAMEADSRSDSRSESRSESESRGSDSVISYDQVPVRSVPELDGGYALMALGLLAGLVLVVRERRKA